MKKKIGFIDYYIDEFHAWNFPKYLAESASGAQFEIGHAWEKTTPAGKKSLDEFCAQTGIKKARSIEEVIEKSDVLMVLSPDDADQHEELARLALQSGKPTFVDKPIANELVAAKRMFELAAKHKTPMCSCSSLRFDTAYVEAMKGPLAGKPINFVVTHTQSVFPIYAVHHLEMIVPLMSGTPRRLLQSGNEFCSVCTIDYGDGKRALINTMPGHPWHLAAYWGAHNQSKEKLVLTNFTDFFVRMMDRLGEFYNTGVSPVPEGQTLQIAALLEAGMKGLKMRDQWVEVPRV